MRSLTALTTANIPNTANGIITVNAGGTPGFCPIKVTGMDQTVTQTQGELNCGGESSGDVYGDGAVGEAAAWFR